MHRSHIIITDINGVLDVAILCIIKHCSEESFTFIIFRRILIGGIKTVNTVFVVFEGKGELLEISLYYIFPLQIFQQNTILY